MCCLHLKKFDVFITILLDTKEGAAAVWSRTKMFYLFARLRNSQGLESNIQIFPSIGVFRIWGHAVLFVSINVSLTQDPARE